MRKRTIYKFGDHRLDTANERLFKHQRQIPLPPKAYAMLAYFIRRHSVLVTKDELLEAVWGGRYVSEGVLKTTVQLLRQALDDQPKAPRYLETVHRRGYRFIAPVTETGDLTVVPAAVSDSPPALVGREVELARLLHCYGLAKQGLPQMVFVTGEAGIGKSSLIGAFIAAVGAEAVKAFGQCVEQYGQSEPYLPFLEALNDVCRQQADIAVPMLAKIAPDWLMELPWLQENGNAPDMPANNTPVRMLRELGELLVQWSGCFPIILVLEDLHWSDWATLDALAYLARGKQKARWLILGSYRPEQLDNSTHPLMAISRDLQIRQLATEVALPLLSEQAVAAYFQTGCSRIAEKPGLIHAIHRRTEGLPLFMVQLAQMMNEAGETDVFAQLPDGLQQLIEHQFERLPAKRRRLLSMAAVAGSVFSVALLAELTGWTAAEVANECEQLARGKRFLARTESGFDPAAADCYGFRHIFYHEYTYCRQLAADKRQWHRRIAGYLASQDLAGSDDMLLELAFHYEQGGLFERACEYLQKAVDLAIRRHAPHEVTQLVQRALAIAEQHLQGTVHFSERRMLGLYAALIAGLQATEGFAAAAIRPIYDKVLHYAPQDNPRQLAAILWGLGCFLCVRGEILEANTCCWSQLQALAERSGDLLAAICGEVGAGCADMYTGNVMAADWRLQQAAALYDPERDVGLFDLVAIHPIVLCAYFRSQTLWLLGEPDQSLGQAGQAVAMAEREGQPFSISFALWGLATCHQLRGEVLEAQCHCDAAMALSQEHNFVLITKLAALVKGWCQLELAELALGVEGMRTGLLAIRATGGKLTQTHLLALSCASCLARGLLADAQYFLAQAWEVLEQSGERFFEAELYRLNGEISLLQARKQEAGHCFSIALQTARQQGAKALQWRATESLTRL